MVSYFDITPGLEHEPAKSGEGSSGRRWTGQARQGSAVGGFQVANAGKCCAGESKPSRTGKERKVVISTTNHSNLSIQSALVEPLRVALKFGTDTQVQLHSIQKEPLLPPIHLDTDSRISGNSAAQQTQHSARYLCIGLRQGQRTHVVIMAEEALQAQLQELEHELEVIHPYHPPTYFESIATRLD